jgi:hypothetical protein
MVSVDASIMRAELLDAAGLSPISVSELSDAALANLIAWRCYESLLTQGRNTASRILSAIELALIDGDDGAMNLVTTGVLEDLGNITSHSCSEVGVEDVVALLHPRSLVAWSCLGLLFDAICLRLPEIDEVLERRNGEPVKHFDNDVASQVANEELRRQLMSSVRVVRARTVGIYDLATYESMVGPWFLPVLKAALAPLRSEFS